MRLFMIEARKRLTAKTKTRSAVKGYVAPPNVGKFGPLPSLRSKVMGIFAIQFLSSVQVVGHESYTYSAADEQWSLTIWTAAAG